MSEGERTLAAAEAVTTLLATAGVGAAIIGAAALAVHHYARSTEDLDLAVGVEPRRLAELARVVRAAGYTAEVSEPDPDDGSPP